MGTEEMSTRIDAKAGFNQSHNEGSVLNEGQQKVTLFAFFFSYWCLPYQLRYINFVNISQLIY